MYIHMYTCSHLMAAVGVTVELEAPGAVLCPLFVGSSTGSRDTRLLLRSLVRMLLEAIRFLYV